MRDPGSRSRRNRSNEFANIGNFGTEMIKKSITELIWGRRIRGTVTFEQFVNGMKQYFGLFWLLSIIWEKYWDLTGTVSALYSSKWSFQAWWCTFRPELRHLRSSLWQACVSLTLNASDLAALAWARSCWGMDLCVLVLSNVNIVLQNALSAPLNPQTVIHSCLNLFVGQNGGFHIMIGQITCQSNSLWRVNWEVFDDHFRLFRWWY